MKTLPLVLLAVALTSGMADLTSCAEVENTISNARQSVEIPSIMKQQPSVEFPKEETPAASSGINPLTGGVNLFNNLWSDFPVYEGAKQLTSSNWSIPAISEQNYSRIEWRYYETTDTPLDVAAFYKKQMAANGWTSENWTDTPAIVWGTFEREAGKTVGVVYFVKSGGKTNITLMSAQK